MSLTQGMDFAPLDPPSNDQYPSVVDPYPSVVDQYLSQLDQGHPTDPVPEPEYRSSNSSTPLGGSSIGCTTPSDIVGSDGNDDRHIGKDPKSSDSTGGSSSSGKDSRSNDTVSSGWSGSTARHSRESSHPSMCRAPTAKPLQPPILPNQVDEAPNESTLSEWSRATMSSSGGMTDTNRSSSSQGPPQGQ
jgi:hypothetical protein